MTTAEEAFLKDLDDFGAKYFKGYLFEDCKGTPHFVGLLKDGVNKDHTVSLLRELCNNYGMRVEYRYGDKAHTRRFRVLVAGLIGGE